MAFVIDGINDTFRGIAELVFTEKYADGSGNVLVMPKPANFALTKNPQQVRIPTTDSSGYSTFQGAFVKGYDWQMQISYANMQPEILQLRLGQKFNKLLATEETLFSRSIYVYQTEIPAISSTDIFAEAVVEQVPAIAPAVDLAKASVLTGNFSEPLTLVAPPAAGASLTGTKRFAIGDGYALYFSPDLLGQTVTITCPYTVPVSAYKLTNEVLPRYTAELILVTTSNEAVLLRVFDCSVNVEGAGITPGAESIDVPFFVNQVPGKSIPFDWYYTGKSIILN